jgi:hypothetical protein
MAVKNPGTTASDFTESWCVVATEAPAAHA